MAKMNGTATMRKMNGILVQRFTAMIAYTALMMIRDISFPENKFFSICSWDIWSQ